MSAVMGQCEQSAKSNSIISFLHVTYYYQKRNSNIISLQSKAKRVKDKKQKLQSLLFNNQ